MVKPTSFRVEAAGVLDLDGFLAHEIGLGLADRPGHVGFVGMRQAVGVLADDDVALLQPQHALGLDAERLDVEGLARLHQRVPHMLAHSCAGMWIS